MNRGRHSDERRDPVTDNLDLWTSALLVKSTAGRGSNGRLEAYGIKKLRELILELAVRGKLLSQDSNDEPAAELIKRAHSEKAKMIKNGKIKKDKDFPDIAEDEIPFDCPSGWQWARINDVGHDLGQKAPDAKFTYVDVSAIDNSRGVIDAPTVLEASDAPSRARKIVKKGTVIYSTVRPYLKNICVLDQDYSPEPIASTAFAVLYPFQEMPGRFFAMYFRSPEFVRYVERVQTGIAYPAINDKQFYGALVPVPPLKEQHRIVAKVDELMTLCDQLEQRQGQCIEAHQTLVETLLGTLTNVESDQEFTAAWNRIAEHFDTLFTTEHSIDRLKQNIFQLAVMGKLIPQDSDDEPASILLKRVQLERKNLIAEGKIKKNSSFPELDASRSSIVLPNGWSWALIPQVVSNEKYAIKRGPFGSAIRKDFFVPSGYKVYEQQNAIRDDFALGDYYINQDKFNELMAFEIKPNDIIISCSGTVGKVAVAPLWMKPGVINQALLKLTLNESALTNDYFKILFPAFYMKTETLSELQGTAQKNMVSVETLKEEPFPLPPLAEQHRIVAKVDELMALCDALKARLAEAQTTQIRLADAIVERAVAASESASA